jgi:hypothetical protein
MKAIKIILAVAAVAVIGFFVAKGIIKLIDDPGKYRLSDYQFEQDIRNEIDSLNRAPANVFCQQFYRDIQYHISEYHKQGLFDKNSVDNSEIEGILSSDLYSAYTRKFTEQAMHVFDSSEWTSCNMELIRSEVKMLKSSVYLDKSSNYFKQIDEILQKYYEIAGFIDACNEFSYSADGITDRFPDVSDKIQKSQDYLRNNLGNTYVNKCARLKNGLSEIPQTLFSKHVSYLKDKISKNSGKYLNYNLQINYSDTIYTPLRNQIENLKDNVYSMIDSKVVKNGYNSLLDLLAVENRKASDHIRSIKQQVIKEDTE